MQILLVPLSPALLPPVLLACTFQCSYSPSPCQVSHGEWDGSVVGEYAARLGGKEPELGMGDILLLLAGLHFRPGEDEPGPEGVQDHAHGAPHEPAQEQTEDDRGNGRQVTNIKLAILQVMFEHYGFDAAIQAMLTLYAQGLLTGMAPGHLNTCSIFTCTPAHLNT